MRGTLSFKQDHALARRQRLDFQCRPKICGIAEKTFKIDPKGEGDQRLIERPREVVPVGWDDSVAPPSTTWLK